MSVPSGRTQSSKGLNNVEVAGEGGREGGRRGTISGCVHTRLGPRDMHALAWSRISIDIARVRSGSVNPDASRPRCLRRCIAKGTSEEWKVAPPRALENASIASFPIRGERAFRLVFARLLLDRFWRGLKRFDKRKGDVIWNWIIV